MRDEHSGAFLRLEQLWRHGSQFSLLLAAVDDSAYRDALIARLHALSPALRIDLGAADTPEDWLHQLQAARASDAERIHVCLPISPQRTDGWWQQANVLRERFAEAFPATQLLWMSDADIDAAAHHAPDLWNWRQAVFGFSVTSMTSVLSVSAVEGLRFNPSGSADSAAVSGRLSQIEQLLAGGKHEDAEVSHLLLEAAQTHLRLGQWSAAEAAAQRAALGFEIVGNDAAMAHARSLAAELRWRLGDPEGALLSLQVDVMPIYERLGDMRSKAVTLGKIADILQARGQLDEALRILKAEQLPVFQRLGDVRAKAVTMGKIADILQERGEPDEALRIRKEKQMPVYESLGDARAMAVTLGKIAIANAGQGRRAEASRVLTNEVLPVFEKLGLASEAEFTRQQIAALKQRK